MYTPKRLDVLLDRVLAGVITIVLVKLLGLI